jgi:hypothetical protein
MFVLGGLGLSCSVALAECGDYVVMERHGSQVDPHELAEIAVAVDVLSPGPDSESPALPCRGPQCQRQRGSGPGAPSPRVTDSVDKFACSALWPGVRPAGDDVWFSSPGEGALQGYRSRVERPPRRGVF